MRMRNIVRARDPNGRQADLEVALDTDDGIVIMKLLNANCMSITNAIEDYASAVAESFPMEPAKFTWIYIDSGGVFTRVELDWEGTQASNPRWPPPRIKMEDRPWMKEIMDAP